MLTIEEVKANCRDVGHKSEACGYHRIYINAVVE